MACAHGHLDIVKYLLKQGADPYLESFVDITETESILEVSARWSHTKIVVYLLENIRWNKRTIIKAKKNKMIDKKYKVMFGEYYKTHLRTNLCSCLCNTFLRRKV